MSTTHQRNETGGRRFDGPLTAVDAAWLHMDQPTNLMIITSVLTLAEVPDWDSVTSLIHERIVQRYPRFAQRVADLPLRRPRWVDDPDFDLAAHLHTDKLPAPGDDEALQAFVGGVTGRPLDHGRPLWEAWLLDGFGDGAAIVFRIHHCVADGVALAKVLLSLTEETEGEETEGEETAGEETAGEVVVDAAGVPPDHDGDHGLRHLIDVARHAGAEAVRQGAGIARALAHDTLLSRDTDTVFRGQQSEEKVVAWSTGVPLAQVREAAHGRSATVNDMLLAMLSGALGSYLRAAGSAVAEVRAMVPVNLRPPDQPLPVTLGNRFGLVFCPLPVGEPDVDARLVAVKAAMDHIKATPEAITSIALLVSMGVSPQPVEDALIDFFGAKASMVVTNVPGPREGVFLAGVPVTGVLSWAPQSGPITMSITIFSYAGQVSVGVLTDPALVPDPGQIVAAFDAEVTALGI